MLIPTPTIDSEIILAFKITAVIYLALLLLLLVITHNKED